MKAILNVLAVTVLLAAPGPCFALWGIDQVTKGRAKELGLEVRSQAAGPDHVRVELEFKPEGQLKGFSHVDLRFGSGDNPPLTAPLREDRSKPGRVVVSFTADRTYLDQIRLWIMVPGSEGGTVHDIRVTDFVGPAKGR